MKRKTWTILLAITLVIVVSGCGSSNNNGNTASGNNKSKATNNNENEKTIVNVSTDEATKDLSGQTVTVYATDVDTEGWDQLVQTFEQKTGVKVKSVKAPSEYSANVQKLTVNLSSGDSAYDIVYIDELMAMNFQSAGFLAPFSDEVFPSEVRGNYNEDSLKNFSLKDGKYYALPNLTSAMLLFANKKIFEEANVAIPTNAEEFMDAAKKLTKADGSQYGYGAAWTKGGQLFNDAIRWTIAYGGDYNDWSNPNTQQAFKAMYDFIYENKIIPKSVIGDSYDALNKGFIDGKYAMIYNWNGFAGQMGDEFGESLVVIPNIQFTSNKTIGSTWFYAINKHTKNMDAANAFMKWIASEEGQSMVIQLPVHSSGNKKVLQTSEFQINKYLFEYMDVNSITTRPLTENVNEIMDQTETVLSKYLTNQISLEQAVTDGQKIFEKLIK